MKNENNDLENAYQRKSQQVVEMFNTVATFSPKVNLKKERKVNKEKNDVKVTNSGDHNCGTSNTVSGNSRPRLPSKQCCQGDFCFHDIHTYTSIGSNWSATSDISKFSIPSIKTVRLQAKKMKTKKHDIDDQDYYVLPLVIIEQARKEKYLVDNLLQRYQQGPPHQQVPEYLCNSQDELHLAPVDENSITNILNIYSSATLCQTCYYIYNLIHNARATSMEKIHSMTRKTHQRSPFLSKEGKGTTVGIELIKAAESVLVRSLLAIQCVSKADLHEIRSFQSPPSAVLMSVSALFMVLLRDNHYKRIGWMEARSTLLSNVDQVFHEMSHFTPKDIKLSQWDAIDQHILQNALFWPEKILPISKAAAKICAWVLGMTNGFRWQQFLATSDCTNQVIHRDPLMKFPDFAVAAGIQLKSPVGDSEKIWSDEMQLRSRLKVAQRRSSKSKCTLNKQVQGSMFFSNDGSREDGDATASKIMQAVKLQHQADMRVNKVDIRQECDLASISRFFTSSGAMTRIPYEVLSSPGNFNPTSFFVVCHDIFDTLESTKLLFLSLIKRYPKCRVLLFNYPGQARTDFLLLSTQLNCGGLSKETNEPVLHNDFLAGLLNELLVYVRDQKEFDFTDGSCYLVGLGIGVSVSMSFALLFGGDIKYNKCLKAILSINGCIHIDSHLASILHTSLNFFRSIPENQSKLAQAYFTKHFFSDTCGDNATMKSALNMYTAIANPITLQGRIKLCNGALKNRDLRQDIENLVTPIIAVQSIGNIFILPTNTDEIMEKRLFIRILSTDLLLHGNEHEGCYTETVKCSISSRLMEKKGGVVVSIQGGHAVAQESMRIIVDTLSILADLVSHHNIRSDFEPLQIKSNLRPNEFTFLGGKRGLSLVDNVVENRATDCLANNWCSCSIESLSNNNPLGRIVGQPFNGMRPGHLSDSNMNPLPKEELPENEKVSQSSYPRGNFPITRHNRRHESLLHWLFDESSFSLEKFSEALNGIPCLPEQESLPHGSSKTVETNLPMFSSNAKEHNQSVTCSSFQSSPSDFDHMAESAASPGCFYLNSYKEGRIIKGKLEEAIRSQLESVNSCLSSYSHEHVETAIHKSKTSPWLDDFNAFRTPTAGTPPTYDEIIRQATAELESEQARDIMRIRNMRIRKQHQMPSMHRHENFSRHGPIMDTYQRQAVLQQLSCQVQKLSRGYLERRKDSTMETMMDHFNTKVTLSIITQRYSRSKLALKHAKRIKEKIRITLSGSMIALNLQRLRQKQLRKRQVNFIISSITIQTWARTIFCRKKAKIEFKSASKVQRIWRNVTHFRLSKNQELSFTNAATKLQRLFRQLIDRIKSHEMKIRGETKQNSTNLVLEKIEEARNEFDRQKLELDCIKECRVKAERLRSVFCEGLKRSEQELTALRSEVNLEEEQGFKRRNVWKKNEVRTSKLKRVDEVNLNTMVKEVETKKEKLKSLEQTIASIDEDKSRKEAELRHAEESLINLLNDQNSEVDSHSKESTVVKMGSLAPKTPGSERSADKIPLEMLCQQEEFLKFQLMSISLSCLSSMKLLKDLRNASFHASDATFMNSSDLNHSAKVSKPVVSGPSGSENKLLLCNVAGDALHFASAQSDKLINENTDGGVAAPTNCRHWTISHVLKWLEGLSLGKYAQSFAEACIDGEMLLELTEDDLIYALGIEHKLHRKKILVTRDRLRHSSVGVKNSKPSSDAEENLDGESLLPEVTALASAVTVKPDVRTVFSHVRHRRIAALEKIFEKGLDMNIKDDQGNSLLMVAVQNKNTTLVDLLLRRGSSVNDVNKNGNSALHFALAYDTTGQLAQFLIEHGADDTIENNLGLTPYDGLGEEESRIIPKVDGDEAIEDNSFATNISTSSLTE